MAQPHLQGQQVKEAAYHDPTIPNILGGVAAATLATAFEWSNYWLPEAVVSAQHLIQTAAAIGSTVLPHIIQR